MAEFKVVPDAAREQSLRRKGPLSPNQALYDALDAGATVSLSVEVWRRIGAAVRVRASGQNKRVHTGRASADGETTQIIWFADKEPK